MIKLLLSLLPFISMPRSLAGVLVTEREDLGLLATVLVLEAGGDGYDGMYAVGSVIRNRALASHESLTKTVKAHGQFSCLNGGLEQARKNAANRSNFWIALKIAG